MNSALITTLAALFVFGLLITTHELGHFIAAKLSNVPVLEFAIGMGPKLFSFKKGETKYSLRLLPIGGYNKMLGEGEESSDPRAFSNQGPWKRLGIIVAGAFMNFLIAMILFVIVSYNMGFLKPIVSKIEPKLPAASAGMKINDEIVSINGNKITGWNDFTDFVSANKNKPFKVLVKRNSQNVELSLTPVFNQKEKRYMVGISATAVKGSFGESVKRGASLTFTSIKEMFLFLGKLIHGKVSSSEVGGPVAIIKISGQVAANGFLNLLYLTAFLSVNLGFINLVPFPALDGGWVVILLFEALTGKKIDENKIGVINLIGFTVLMGLVILVTFNDILRLKTY